MAHTFTNLLTHVIFSTKGRTPSIQPEWRPALHAYLGGIVRELEGRVITVNGTADHVHLLLFLPAALSISQALRVLKANSSRWINRSGGTKRNFAWQTGYGAFSVSQSSALAVVKYINAQETHHRSLSFEEEFVMFLKKHRIEYDERYLRE